MLYNVVVVVCHTLTYISHNFIYIYIYIYPLPLEPPSSLSRHSTPLGCHRVPGWAPCVTQQLPTKDLFIHESVYMSVLFSQFVLPSPSLAVFTRSFFMFLLRMFYIFGTLLKLEH